MKKFIFVFLALFYSLAYAEETPAFDFSPVSEDNVSLVLYDIETQKNVLSINADKPFLYASNLKLLTSAVALKQLGGGFKFLTLFSFDKESGTLYIKAGGDIITKLDDNDIISFDAFVKKLADYSPDDIISVTVMRQSNKGYTEIKTQVTLESATHD